MNQKLMLDRAEVEYCISHLSRQGNGYRCNKEGMYRVHRPRHGYLPFAPPPQRCFTVFARCIIRHDVMLDNMML